VTVFLQGCGVPPIVKQECYDRLSLMLAQTGVSGLQSLEAACMSTFVVNSQQQQCIVSGTDLEARAKHKIILPMLDSCTEYVAAEVCKKGSDCEGRIDKMSPAKGFAAVQQFVSAKNATLTVSYQQKLDAEVREVVQAHYDTKYQNREMPDVIKEQCKGYQNQKEAQVIIPPETPSVAKVAMRCGEAWGNFTDAGSLAQKALCLSLTVQHIYWIKSVWREQYIRQCEQQTLATACPPGSTCGIETYFAPFNETDNIAFRYIHNNWESKKADLHARLELYAGTVSVLSHWADGENNDIFGSIKKHFNVPGTWYARLYNRFPKNQWEAETPSSNGPLAAAAAILATSVAGLGFVAIRRSSRSRPTFAALTPTAMENCDIESMEPLHPGSTVSAEE